MVPNQNESVKPLLSVVVPAFNEAAIIGSNLEEICRHLDTLEDRFRWEIVVVDDGSSDDTGSLAESFAANNERVRVVHHQVNLNLGQALRTGFHHSRGEYVVVMDLDLSYSPDHIGRMLSVLHDTGADMVVASPYMKGGKVTKVPWLRLFLSRAANRFLKFFSSGTSINTLTGMVRAYNAAFLRTLDLKATGVDINAEVIYKATVLGGRILEIPAHLDWSLQRVDGLKRVSSFNVARGILRYALSGFMFRPFMFFFLPGLALLAVSLYVIAWIFLNVYAAYPQVSVQSEYFDERFSEAVGLVFRQRPHAFLVGGITLLFSLQLLSLGFLSLQGKRYFEELYHLASMVRNAVRKDRN